MDKNLLAIRSTASTICFCFLFSNNISLSRFLNYEAKIFSSFKKTKKHLNTSLLTWHKIEKPVCLLSGWVTPTRYPSTAPLSSAFYFLCSCFSVFCHLGNILVSFLTGMSQIVYLNCIYSFSIFCQFIVFQIMGINCFPVFCITKVWVLFLFLVLLFLQPPSIQYLCTHVSVSFYYLPHVFALSIIFCSVKFRLIYHAYSLCLLIKFAEIRGRDKETEFRMLCSHPLFLVQVKF